MENRSKPACHVSINIRYMRAIDKYTQTRLSKSFDGIEACMAWWDRAKWRNGCPAWY